MMKKYLFISNSTKPTFDEEVSRERIKLSNVSLLPIEVAESYGYQIYMGINRVNPEELECENKKDINFYNSSTYRSLLDIKSNITAFSNLLKLLKKEDVQVIHCNTPIGGLVGRLCGKFANVPKVIYTAHGFHFYKGAPIFNRTVLKWAERWLAHYTDAIITMNNEDYEAAQQFKLRKNGTVHYVPGVGLDTKSYHIENLNKEELRKSLSLKNDDIILISMGDLVARKNFSASIKAIAETKNDKAHFVICGKGPELESLKLLAKSLGVERNIHFLGYRTDIKELLTISDIFLFTTYQEGLPRSMMEAMATGLPCIASNIRGNNDLIEDRKGGYLRESDDIKGLAEAISALVEDRELRKSMGNNNLNTIKKFDVDNVKREIASIYGEVLN